MNERHHSFLIFIFLLISQVALGYDKDLKVSALTPTSKVSLLTVGRSDDELYQYFGHTAIRVKDSILGWDLVYNYGTFTYPGDELKEEVDFLMKFIRCKLMYYESIDNYKDFEDMYREENRWIREQPLNLTLEERQDLFTRLTINAREENKYYRYDFLFDNCSTRPRDMVLSVFKKVSIREDKDDRSTFRQLIDRNVKNEWVDLGMDLLIGLPTDKHAGIKRTFLPEELMQAFDHTTVDGKLLASGNRLLLDVIPENRERQWFTPGLVFWLLFFVVVLLQVKTSLFSRYKILPVIYFTILGLFGWLFLFMWFGTQHTSTKGNLNILWAMPLNIPLMFLALKKNIPGWIRNYIKTYRILLIALLIGWWANPQTYHISVVPLILIAILFTSLFLPVPTTGDFKRRWFG